MRNAELDEDRLLAAEVEGALKSLRIAGVGEDDGDLRSAVDHLRRASQLLGASAITDIAPPRPEFSDKRRAKG